MASTGALAHLAPVGQATVMQQAGHYWLMLRRFLSGFPHIAWSWFLVQPLHVQVAVASLVATLSLAFGSKLFFRRRKSYLQL